jgi:hypothetical protein
MSRPRMRRLWWKARVPLLVAAARVRAQPGRAGLVVLGVAASLGTLVAVLGESVAARDRALSRAVAALPAEQRSFRVDAFGLPSGDAYRAADRTVRAALAPLSTAPPLRGEFLRRLRFGRSYVQLGGIDRPGLEFRLSSGRLPRSCTPSRCEVLQLGAGREREWTAPGLRFVRVGTADPAPSSPFGGSVAPAPGPGGARTTVLIASGAAPFDRLPGLDGFLRTYSWIVPLDPARLHLWQISEVLAGETQAQNRLARSSDLYRLSGPDDALLAARDRGRVAANRMLLLGGELTALLLVFALVSAVGLRRGLANEQRRLRQRGAGPLQLWLGVAAEIAFLTVVGASAGIAVASGALAAIERSQVLAHSLVTSLGLATVAGAWLASTVAVMTVAGVTVSGPRASRMRLLEVAALGALVALLVALTRGALSPTTAGSSRNATLLLILPGLLSFLIGFAAVRLFGPLVRGIERLARGGPLAARLALLGLGRASTTSRMTATFVVVSLGLALFALSYRSTLAADARDEASFKVPLDFALSEGPALVRPIEAASSRRYMLLAPGVRAYPVVRQSATMAGQGTSVLSPTVLGVPAAALEHMRWRSDYSSLSRDEIARRLAASGPARVVGSRLPLGSRSVSISVELAGVPVALALALENGAGEVTSVPLGERPAGRWRLRARLPAGSRQVVGLEVSIATSEQLGLTHRSAEDQLSSAAAGAAELGPLLVGRTRVSAWRGWLATGASATHRGGRLRLAYSFPTGGTVVLRRRQATDGRPLSVLVSPAVAEAAGPSRAITLDFGGSELPARIVGTASRFPAADDQGYGFVIADESRLATALDAARPGTGTPGELWLSVPSGERATVARRLTEPPFARLVLASRSSLQRSLSADPLARGVVVTLELAAIVSLFLALAGFGVALASELRDERGELFDMEAQGVAPATLRAQFRLRAACILCFGVLGGVALGLALSRLTVDVVRVSATTGVPEPPLRFDSAWTIGAAAVALLILAVLLLVEVATQRGFRADVPARASWSLE